MRRLAPFVTFILVACSEGTEPADPSLPATLPPTVTTTSIAPPTPTAPRSGEEGTTTTTVTSPSTTVAPAPLEGLAYEAVAAVEFPIMMTARAGDDVALLALRDGIVQVFADGDLGDTVLDISSSTVTGGERGLLGLARHPEDDARLFAHYSSTNGDTVLSEFRMEGLSADPATERVLLEVDQPAANHNGGMIQFGPDGALYLGLGDGGGSGDRFGNGQNLESLLGGIVRVDVDSGESELWFSGLRNPWRFWIDGDDIWIADVGQNSYEEIDLVEIADAGTNFGWPIAEAGHCFAQADCDLSGLTGPLVEIERGDGGTCSITGGVVYRGEDIPELDGRFLFSDYCGGYLRSVDSQGDVVDHTGDVGAAGSVVSFGVDSDGEIYVLTTDRMLKIVPVR